MVRTRVNNGKRLPCINNTDEVLTDQFEAFFFAYNVLIFNRI